jgi:hypothetical protein
MRLRRLRPEGASRAPFFVGALFGVPIFFMSLLISSLALDTPNVVDGKAGPTATGPEAKVWLVALIGPAIFVGLGLVALWLGRFGAFLPIVAAIVACLLAPGRADAYIAGHEARFPDGMDFIKDNTTGNASSRGDWEHAAKDAVVSMSHWTLVLALLALGVALLVVFRRPEPLMVENAGIDPIVGAPETLPMLETVEADSELARGGMFGRWRNRNS